MKRWVLVTALVIAAAVAFVTLRERASPPLEEEIDDASKQALREILRQEDE